MAKQLKVSVDGMMIRLNETDARVLLLLDAQTSVAGGCLAVMGLRFFAKRIGKAPTTIRGSLRRLRDLQTLIIAETKYPSGGQGENAYMITAFGHRVAKEVASTYVDAQNDDIWQP